MSEPDWVYKHRANEAKAVTLANGSTIALTGDPSDKAHSLRGPMQHDGDCGWFDAECPHICTCGFLHYWLPRFEGRPATASEHIGLQMTARARVAKLERVVAAAREVVETAAGFAPMDVAEEDHDWMVPGKTICSLGEALEDLDAPKGANMPRCPGCGNEIDPECCGCGEGPNVEHDGHYFIPMGCTCYRAKEEKA